MAIKTTNNIFKTFFAEARYYLRGVYVRFIEDDILFLASGIAFNIIFCLIPLLLLFSSLIGSLLNSTQIATENIQELVAKALPNRPYASEVSLFAGRIIHDLVEFRKSMGMIGLLVLIYTSTSLFSAVRSALHRIYRIASTRSILIAQVKDVLLVFALGILFLLLTVFHWLYAFINEFSSELFRRTGAPFFTGLPEYIPVITTFLLLVLIAFIAYRFIPFSGTTTRSSLIAALMTTILWEASGFLFSWYLETFHPFNALYGTYAFILVTMVWIYYSSVVFVVGGAIGVLWRERREGDGAEFTRA
ncbi:MAG: YihY/virulence factor BrkB family protein [Bacteroidota bacterium]|nr:YihY/virulence factor BrkB family protein [Bacteroidota bacterium]